MLWTKVSGRPGQDLRKIRDLVVEARSFKKVKQRMRKMNQVASYFETFAANYETYNLPIIGENNGKFLAVFFCLGRHSGSYLSSLYLAIKILNFFNLIFNFGLLSSFLSKSYWRYGYDGMKSIFTTGDWGDPYNFPRVLICDFEMPDASAAGTTDPSSSGASGGSPVIYEVKCMMSINLMLEKVFLVFWFWLIILFWVTLANLFQWFLKIKEPCSHIFFVKDYMKLVYQSQKPQKRKDDDASSSSSSSDDSSVYISKSDRDMIERFVEDYIRSDGVFMLRLLELNADRSIAADVIICLWNRYKKLQLRKDRKGNIQRIEQLILENESKNAHMAKFLTDAQRGRKARSNLSLSRFNRDAAGAQEMKGAKSLPLLGDNARKEELGLSTITGVVPRGGHQAAALNLQDVVNNNPGGSDIPMQDLASIGGYLNKRDELGGGNIPMQDLASVGGYLGDKEDGPGGFNIPMQDLPSVGGFLGDKADDLGAGLGGIGGGLGGIGEGLGGIGGGLGDKLGGLGDQLGGIGGGLGGIGGGLGDKLGGLGDQLGGVGGGLGDKLGGLGDQLGGIGGGLGDKLGGLGGASAGGGGGLNLPGGMDLPGGLNFGGGNNEGGGGVGDLFNQRF
ncbi:innexin [Elysia marginata]|uniref:Innexin n=1 Tax=Elysia marginata TaxID=1093978 RepID=A0AAV4HJF4_9GAST|nr:innexin [Elysia marginata]